MLAPRDNHLDRAWQTAFELVHGRISLSDVAKQVADASAPALQARVDGLLRQVTSLSEADNEARLAELFGALGRDENGRLVDFPTFKGAIDSELAGVVFTAHPTFALSDDANELARSMVRDGSAGAPRGGGAKAAPRAAAAHRESAPTLRGEMESSNAAIANARGAMRRMLHVAVRVAQELYPNDWRALNPRIATIATWVGFDLDGRTDIGWSKSLYCRYRLALAGLESLAELAHGLRAQEAGTGERVAASLASIDASLAAFTECFAIGLQALGADDPTPLELGWLNRVALEKRALKQDAIGAIDDALAALLEPSTPDALCRDAIVFRAEWQGLGLGLARLHFRLNAAQLHNAIRPEIALHSAPGKSPSRRYYLAEITRLLDTVSAVNVHYGTVAREQTTAKRMFMLAAQFQKHFDGRTPIRLLIAESDTPFTLLAALYYAKLFGVEDHLEISPLFETADGLHHGDRVIGELLDNAHFRNYIRARRRFCVQLGFSDSGRYIGQPAATLAVERFKLRLIRSWRAHGLTDVQLVFFDTHGESIGRGAHPRSLADRFLYTHPREVRHQLDGLAAPHKHEVSFQGGEGYLWFASARTAFAVLTDLVSVRLSAYRRDDDALYAHSGWALDFFLTLKDYQERATQHAGYLELVNALGRDLLYPTGSRASRRQGSGRAANEIEHISQLRAIPNNAVLHQLAYLANSCAGLGAATQAAPETFQTVLEDSDRLERVVSLALTARERSDLTMLEAYVQLMSPAYWLDRTGQSLDRDWNKQLRRLSRVVEHTFDHGAMASFVRSLRHDAAALDDVLDERHASGAWSSADALTRLHTLRLALLHFIYVKAMEIPQFSSRLEISLDDLVSRLLRSDGAETVETLKQIFPAADLADDSEAYGERDTYVRTAPSGYAAEHRAIFEPIAGAHRLVLELSALIALHVGAYG